MKMQESSVSIHTLSNGLTVLIKPVHTVPKISLQLWYAVGSKHEVANQRGLAHLLEHMLFKGTTRFSELDITQITHKFSGYCNAFTSCDYTAYVFDFPKQYWEIGLDILSDTMHNCTFKEELLASELKTVIQELKAYNDDYESILLEQMMSLIFADHPYRYPIIGSRYDLLRVTSSALFEFYTMYYAPNNATLVIVGDISPEQALSKVSHYFNPLKPSLTLPEKEYHFEKDIAQKSLLLYRDIAQPVLFVSWVIPGIQKKEEHIFDAICWLLCKGKGSRLYKKLIYEKNLAIEVDGFVYDFFEYGLLYVRVVPVLQEYSDEIIALIKQEVAHLVATLAPLELTRAAKQIVAEYSFNSETMSDQASILGEHFLALGTVDYPLQSYEQIRAEIDEKVNRNIELYLSASSMHSAQLIPLEEAEKKHWHSIQDELDAFDEHMLSKKVRTLPLEQSSYQPDRLSKEKDIFTYPVYQEEILSNGLIVIWYHNTVSEQVSLILDFEVDHTYDPDDKQGLCNFVFELLVEGTKKYTAVQLAQKIENQGISLGVYAGKIVARCLTADVSDTLEIINEIVRNPVFEQEAIERVRKKIHAALDDYWDTPSCFVDQLAREKIYNNHPYRKNPLGNKESINKITRADIINFYHRYITPQKTRLAVVGNICQDHITTQADILFGTWKGVPFVEHVYPPLLAPVPEIITYTIDRDQVVICFAGLSARRLSDEYNALFLFDQILIGGTQGSMASRLFSLRERTGLFYAIDGSVVMHADEQPGIIFIKAIVSKDDMAIAEELIKKEINNAVYSITQDELDNARNAVFYEIIDIFESNRSMAESFIFLNRFNLGPNYFTVWMEQLSAITLDDVKRVVQKKVAVEQFITMRIGRVK